MQFRLIPISRLVKRIRTRAIEYNVSVENRTDLAFYLRLDLKNPKIQESEIWQSRAKLGEISVRL